MMTCDKFSGNIPRLLLRDFIIRCYSESDGVRDEVMNAFEEGDDALLVEYADGIINQINRLKELLS